MGKAYSHDLRLRVHRHIAEGHSRRGAGRWFGVSASTAIRLEARYRVSAHGFNPENPISELIHEVLQHSDPNDHKVWGSFDQRIRDAIDEMDPFTHYHMVDEPRFPEWEEWAVKNQTLPLPLVKLMAPIFVRIDLEMAAWTGDETTQSLKPYINQWIELR